jgi:hypothetical protein
VLSRSPEVSSRADLAAQSESYAAALLPDKSNTFALEIRMKNRATPLPDSAIIKAFIVRSGQTVLLRKKTAVNYAMQLPEPANGQAIALDIQNDHEVEILTFDSVGLKSASADVNGVSLRKSLFYLLMGASTLLVVLAATGLCVGFIRSKSRWT